MIFLDLDLARRLEMAEAEACRASAEEVLRRTPAAGAAWQEFAGGWAVFTGVESPLTQVIGAGLRGEVSAEEFEAMEKFFRSRGAAVNLETCPLADASLFELFGARGYRATEFSNVLARSLSRPDRFGPVPPGVCVRRCEPGDERIWAETVAQGFAEKFAVTPEMVSMMESFVLRPGGRTFLAEVGGKTVGGGALGMSSGVAGLFGASTLAEFRGRGVQTALLVRRLEEAAEAGCDVAMSLTPPGSISERNVLRQGFQLLYTRVKFTRT